MRDVPHAPRGARIATIALWPTLRAPKFAEASFKVPSDAKELLIDIRVAK